MQDSRIVPCWGDSFFLPAVSKNTEDKGNIPVLNYTAYKCFHRENEQEWFPRDQKFARKFPRVFVVGFVADILPQFLM